MFGVTRTLAVLAGCLIDMMLMVKPIIIVFMLILVKNVLFDNCLTS